MSVKLIDEPNRNSIEESKISSSTSRIRILGTLLKPVQRNDQIPNKPYVIGLTGLILFLFFNSRLDAEGVLLALMYVKRQIIIVCQTNITLTNIIASNDSLLLF